MLNISNNYNDWLQQFKNQLFRSPIYKFYIALK